MRCPFCEQHVTITDDRRTKTELLVDLGSKHGVVQANMSAIVCPNDACRDIVFNAWTTIGHMNAAGYQSHKQWEHWRLRPQGSQRQFPDYVPKPIRDDHREAGLIVHLSPKASATLSRRCLQGMIRDFWGIKKARLVDEIDALQGKVDTQTWDEIDALRKIGNIGAHMEKDIGVIIDVEPEEAKLLLQLVEDLIETWYVERHNREQRAARIRGIVAKNDAVKTAAKSGPSTPPAAT